ncbi:valine--pyruvate transaminase [Lyngbya confervoides]|uniref:Valine--pyruvate transaminase n=1 Tax=Lyngbya confervoides BDU141951 TaxID=1574623 RepID=A0ABD4T1I8_9CYAN|nr:valine--pyruvate transaminase [Lyngbya confervoides]MCM1982305.1 valine--pyruvate transaminase [Lyngbya confervoides BDU141951]
MPPSLSACGLQMSKLTGVRAIMQDIIETLRRHQDRTFINLSVGNPVILPEVEQLWRNSTQTLLSSAEYGQVVCRYGASQGYEPLIRAVQSEFKRLYNLELSDRQILITPGSQALFFLAANAFGGDTPTGELRKIVLPLSPDYTGYGGVSFCPEALVAYRPALETDPSQHRFKYRPDFRQLQIDASTGCVIFSRPCNPTGNVISNGETQSIAALARDYDVPVFIDSAYGQPFPGLHYTAMQPLFFDQAPNVVHCMSLSKAGLPGERLGIAIGDERILRVLEAFQTNLCIHSSRYGQAIAAQAIASGALTTLADQVIRPYYQQKMQRLEAALDQQMPHHIPWYLHRGEGAIFGWLWFQDLPLSDGDLYDQLKQHNVIVVPGHPFFPGLTEPWPHTHQCIRLSLTASDTDIETGVAAIAKVVTQAYRSPTQIYT